MSRTVTLLTLRNRIRERGEIRSDYVSDSVLNDWINESLQELHERVLSANKDYFLTSTTVSVVSGTATYALPATFLEARGADVLYSGTTDWRALVPFQWADRNYEPAQDTEKLHTRYRIVGSNLMLVPTPGWSGSIKLWYNARATDLASDASTYDGVAGWEEYVVCDVLIKFAGKEESDPSLYLAQKDRIMERIFGRAAMRDVTAPGRIRDVLAERVNSRAPWSRD